MSFNMNDGRSLSPLSPINFRVMIVSNQKCTIPFLIHEVPNCRQSHFFPSKHFCQDIPVSLTKQIVWTKERFLRLTPTLLSSFFPKKKMGKEIFLLFFSSVGYQLLTGERQRQERERERNTFLCLSFHMRRKKEGRKNLAGGSTKRNFFGISPS